MAPVLKTGGPERVPGVRIPRPLREMPQKIPTRRIADIDTGGWCALDIKKARKCLHPEHEPPKMMVFVSGVYEHTCPGCNRTTVFTVNSDAHVDAWTHELM